MIVDHQLRGNKRNDRDQRRPAGQPLGIELWVHQRFWRSVNDQRCDTKPAISVHTAAAYHMQLSGRLVLLVMRPYLAYVVYRWSGVAGNPATTCIGDQFLPTSRRSS